MDRRIAKTKKALIGALQTCLTQYDWGDVSVQMLCDTADISRSTFYAHFEDKQALLVLAMEAIASHLIEDKSDNRGLDLNGTLEILPALLRHMRGHLFLFESTRSSMSGRELSFQFERTIGKIVQEEIANSSFGKSVSKEHSVFLMGGLFAMLDVWRIDGCETPDARLLADLDRMTTLVLAA